MLQSVRQHLSKVGFADESLHEQAASLWHWQHYYEQCSCWSWRQWCSGNCSWQQQCQTHCRWNGVASPTSIRPHSLMWGRSRSILGLPHWRTWIIMPNSSSKFNSTLFFVVSFPVDSTKMEHFCYFGLFWSVAFFLLCRTHSANSLWLDSARSWLESISNVI